MSDLQKRLVAGGVTAVILASLAWGTYLPYRKSKLYVAAISAGNDATSFDDFMTPYLKALNASSPVGQEEIVRNFTQTVSSLVAGIKTADPQTVAIVATLGGVLDQYGRPVLERRSGSSQVQSFSVFASALLRVYEVTNDRPYRNYAYGLLERGIQLSPDRPQMLYLLYEYEKAHGSNEEAISWGKHIVELWPQDKAVEREVKQLENR